VKRADGKPFPDNAVVEVVCLGQTLAAAETRGRFQLVVRQSAGSGGAPGLEGSQGPAGCEVRARLSGFQPATVTLGALSPGGTEIGWVVLHPLLDASGFTYTATTALAPKAARKAWEQGRALLAKGKREEARARLRQATALYPRFAMAWFELGIVHHQLGDAEEARKAYVAAIDADRLFLPPYVQLAMLAASQRSWPVVESLTDEVIRRNPYEFPQAFLYHAVAAYNLGKLDAAEHSVRQAIELDAPGRLPRARLLLARILIETNRSAEAQEPLARYLELTEGKPEAEEGRALLRSQSNSPNPFVKPEAFQ
jgi:Tfp pilus assembly protein PilF